MKRRFTVFAILMVALAMPQSLLAHDFSAISPSGHTLYYYYLTDTTVTVGSPVPLTRMNYDGYTMPTGDLVIPSSVVHDGITYSVTEIRGSAFGGCSGLTSVVIPESVTAIKREAFSFCGLTFIKCLAEEPPALYYDVDAVYPTFSFHNVNTAIPVYVPCGTVEAYQAATYWNLFTNFQTGICYTVTVVSNNVAYGSIMGGGTYSSGQTASLTATPNIGYRFMRWKNGSNETVSENATYSFTVTEDVSLIAEFIPVYTVTLTASGNGSVSTDNATVDQGGTATIHAMATDDCWRFDHWTGGNTNPDRTIENIAANIELVAYFVPITYSVNVGASDHGYAVASSDEVNCGNSVTFTVYPATGYHFDHWAEDGTTNMEYDNIRADMVRTPVFAPNQYGVSVSVTPTEAGTFTINGLVANDGAFDYGTRVEVRFDADWHYTFSGWTVNGADAGAANPYVIDNIAEAYTIVANVTPVEHYIGTNPQNVSILVDGQDIVVGGADGLTVTLYNAAGGLISSQRAVLGTPLRFENLASGTYYVKIGILPAKMKVEVR